MSECANCDGDGVCPGCMGGAEQYIIDNPEFSECPTCSGDGDCPECGGTGEE